MPTFLELAYVDGIKKASLVFGEKVARIFGASTPDGLHHTAIPYEQRKQQYESYLNAKSREAPTSYGRAIGTGAAIGAIPGAVLGGLSGGPRGAIAAGLGGATLGGMTGGLMALGDRNEISDTKRIRNSGQIDSHLARQIQDAIESEDSSREMMQERRHQEMMQALEGRRHEGRRSPYNY